MPLKIEWIKSFALIFLSIECIKKARRAGVVNKFVEAGLHAKGSIYEQSSRPCVYSDKFLYPLADNYLLGMK
jgi:hypothetical protein